jgi:hypothetical protein
MCLTYSAILVPDAYLERLRKEVALAEEGNRKVSDEIGVTAETTANGCFFYLSNFSSLNSFKY